MRSHGDVRQQHEPHPLGAREPLEPRRARARAGEERTTAGRPRPRPRGRACRGPSRARAARPKGRRRRRAETHLGPELVAARCERVGPAPNAATSIVSAKTSIRSGSAPRASIDSRASVPTTRTSAAPRTIAGTTLKLTARRQPGRSSRSLRLDDQHVRDAAQAHHRRRLGGERAPAGREDDLRSRITERRKTPNESG